MSIRETIEPSIVPLGPILVRRVLPSRLRQMVGPFILMDQAGPTRLFVGTDSGVGEHPHAGLATLTYLLEGTVVHRDSAGHVAQVYPGDVALMTAGKGVTHEERPDPSTFGQTQDVYFVQLWLALPDAYENMLPTFELRRHTDLPEANFRNASVWLLIGSAWGLTAPTTQYMATLLADVRIKAGGRLSLDAPYAECGIYVLEGAAEVDGEALQSHTLTMVDAHSRPVLSSMEGCRAIILGGDAFIGSRLISGNFVASSQKLLSQRTDEFRRGGFPQISNNKLGPQVARTTTRVNPKNLN